jgi:hypothetical protein
LVERVHHVGGYVEAVREIEGDGVAPKLLFSANPAALR